MHDAAQGFAVGDSAARLQLIGLELESPLKGFEVGKSGWGEGTNAGYTRFNIGHVDRDSG